MMRHYQLAATDFGIMERLQQRYQHCRLIATVRFAIQQWLTRQRRGSIDNSGQVRAWLKQFRDRDRSKEELRMWNARFTAAHIAALDAIKARHELDNRSEAIRLALYEQAVLDGLVK